MPREPLYPHMPKRREPLFPHLASVPEKVAQFIAAFDRSYANAFAGFPNAPLTHHIGLRGVAEELGMDFNSPVFKSSVEEMVTEGTLKFAPAREAKDNLLIRMSGLLHEQAMGLVARRPVPKGAPVTPEVTKATPVFLKSQILFDDTYKGKRYTYGLTYRPVGYAQVPEGWIIQSNKPSTKFAHGTIDYPRPLTQEEITQYQLTPLNILEVAIPKAEAGQPEAGRAEGEPSYLTESPKPIIQVRPYTSVTPTSHKEYIIEALTPQGQVVGYLGYEEDPEYLRIAMVKVEDRYQGRGYSRALLEKLLEVAGDKPILTGSLNTASWKMLQHEQRQGRIRIIEPLAKFRDITYFQIQPVR